MTDRQLKIRVGAFAVMALTTAAVLVFRFGDLEFLWSPHYSLTARFDNVQGLSVGAPVRLHGLSIGKVDGLDFDPVSGGVLVSMRIHAEHRLRTGSRPQLVRSLLGESSIEFQMGREDGTLEAGSRIVGEEAFDPMTMVDRWDKRFDETISTFHSTSREWQQVAENLNHLMSRNRDQVDAVIARSISALDDFSKTMRQADRALRNTNAVIGDESMQKHIHATLAAMPKLAKETEATITAVRATVRQMERSLTNLNQVTTPLADRGQRLVVNLDRTLRGLESAAGELSKFSKMLNHGEGSLQQLVADPSLYRNLNRSAQSLAILFDNLRPVVRDLRIFSDRIARHPELIGVGGALRGSSGLKSKSDDETASKRDDQSPIRRK